MFGRNRQNQDYNDQPSFFKSLITLLITGCILFLGFSLFTGDGKIKSFKGIIGGNKVKDYQLKYKPAGFEYAFDDDFTLQILSDPKKNQKAFNNFIYDYNMSLINHVCKRMGFPDSLMVTARDKYNEHHAYLKNLYYQDFINTRDPSSNFYRDWYQTTGGSAVDAFKEVSSKYTCFIINQVLTSIIKTKDGMVQIKGKEVLSPCGIAVDEAINPMLKRLKEKSAMIDFMRSKGMLSQKIEKTMAELGTVEIRDKKGLSKSLSTKVLGYDVSKTDLEIVAISILKVGFKLDEYFEISMNSKTKELLVTLPQPTILSHEVYPRIDKLDIGWMRELKVDDFNKNFNLLRAEFKKDLNGSMAFDDSKVKAKEIMEMLLSPILQNGYTMKMNYKGKDNPITVMN